MTEKDYSGATTSKIGKNAKTSNSNNLKQDITHKKSANKKPTDESNITKSSKDNSQLENYKKAGDISKKVKEFAKQLIKPDMPLVDIAEKIEAKILELKGEIAFPVNLSIDDIAAHYTPTLRDETKASGLLNVDIGIHIKGCICDFAFSLDLTKEKKHAKLIEASESALKNALEEIKKSKSKTTLNQVGKKIKETIQSLGFSPIVNLSGHGLDEFEIHSDITIPNYDNQSDKEIGEGAFAIEPFATLSSGSGMIYEGTGSNIYHLTRMSDFQLRDSFAREVLGYLIEEKSTLPFSQRELEKKFGSKALFAISNLKRANIIEEFPQLIEKSHMPVSQAETSVFISKEDVIVLC